MLHSKQSLFSFQPHFCFLQLFSHLHSIYIRRSTKISQFCDLVTSKHLPECSCLIYVWPLVFQKLPSSLLCFCAFNNRGVSFSSFVCRRHLPVSVSFAALPVSEVKLAWVMLYQFFLSLCGMIFVWPAWVFSIIQCAVWKLCVSLSDIFFVVLHSAVYLLK